MDQIHLSPLVDQIQLSLGHISNIYTLYAHLKLAELAALSVVDPLAILAANAIDFITPDPTFLDQSGEHALDMVRVKHAAHVMVPTHHGDSIIRTPSTMRVAAAWR
jgi:hypothetical protein